MRGVLEKDPTATVPMMEAVTEETSAKDGREEQQGPTSIWHAPKASVTQQDSAEARLEESHMERVQESVRFSCSEEIFAEISS